MFEHKLGSVERKRRKSKRRKKKGFPKMNFLFYSKHRAVHFYKILRNTSKEIKSIHGFSPRKAFDIPVSQAKICGDHADVSSPPSRKWHLFIPWC